MHYVRLISRYALDAFGKATNAGEVASKGGEGNQSKVQQSLHSQAARGRFEVEGTERLRGLKNTGLIDVRKWRAR